MMRLAQASAKMRLENEADMTDAKRAVELMQSWIVRIYGTTQITETSDGKASQKERREYIYEVIDGVETRDELLEALNSEFENTDKTTLMQDINAEVGKGNLMMTGGNEIDTTQ
jgi:DNA replicative helicase MCM subunit Mcm2 (Cdc46/Mcm family)